MIFKSLLLVTVLSWFNVAYSQVFEPTDGSKIDHDKALKLYHELLYVDNEEQNWIRQSPDKVVSDQPQFFKTACQKAIQEFNRRSRGRYDIEEIRVTTNNVWKENQLNFDFGKILIVYRTSDKKVFQTGPPLLLSFVVRKDGDVKVQEVLKSSEQAGADQPATKPAEKDPAKDKPSTPTPKGGPR
jgi:hypothetical protein